MKRKFIVFMAALFSWSAFFLPAYLYLDRNLSNGKKAVDKTADNVPYYEVPENRGLEFFLEDGTKILFYLDFTEEIAYIVNISVNNGENYAPQRYPADYEFHISEATVSLLLDRIGGLELNIGGETLRYTGEQIRDITEQGLTNEARLDLLYAVCKQLSKNGFSDSDFVFLIDSSDADLDIPTCANWQKHLKSLFANAIFVNWEL
ncbi:MAG: hypothetical protein IKZ59_04015 [Clostridia bacterium]|nr:hypothetical protein [Clostridia bacterium]